MPCVSFLFFSSGCSNTAQVTSRTTLVNEISQSVLNRHITRLSTISGNTQSFFLDVGGDIKCPLTVNQRINSDVTAINRIGVDQATEIRANLENTVEEQIRNVAANNPNFFQTLFGKAATQSAITDTVVEARNSIQRSVTNETIIDAVNSVINQQEQKIRVGGNLEGPACTFSQDIVSRLQVQNLADTMQRTLVQDRFWNDVQRRIDNEAKGGGGGSGLPWWAWLLIGLVALGILFFIIRRLTGGPGTTATSTLALLGGSGLLGAGAAGVAAAAPVPPPAPYYPYAYYPPPAAAGPPPPPTTGVPVATPAPSAAQVAADTIRSAAAAAVSTPAATPGGAVPPRSSFDGLPPTRSRRYRPWSWADNALEDGDEAESVSYY